MDQQNRSLPTIPEEDIYDFIDLQGLRRYLVDCPNLLLMFEILINHINELKTNKNFILANYFLMITNSVTNQVDKLLIVPILGFALLGNYSLGLQIITVLTILPGIIFKFSRFRKILNFLLLLVPTTSE